LSDLIDEGTVRHVAGLARLRLTDEEVARFSRDLSNILRYVAQLNELDTADVPPTAHPLDVHNVLREDEIGPSVSSEQATANAPDRQDGFFKVPKVLDQEGA